MNVLSSPRNADPDQPAEKPLIENLAMAFGVFVPFFGLVAAIYLLWGRGVSRLDLLLMLGFYTLTTLGITVGFHRMFTHRALAGGPAVRATLAIFGSMSGQGPVLEWCAVHRQHHKHADDDGDPHSPHLHGSGFWGMLKGMFHSHVGWVFAPEPKGVATAAPDLVADPVLRFVDRWFWVWMIGGWLVPGAIAFAITRGSWHAALTGFLWGGLVRTFLLHHVTWSINSVCHVWGTRPYASQDHSRNNAIFGVLAFGEGWHNNHHAFPTSARHGLRWWQLDISWITIRFLKALGLVWDVRLPSASALEVKRNKKAAPVEPEAAPAMSAVQAAVTADPQGSAAGTGTC